MANGQRFPIELEYKTDRIDSDTLYEDTGIPIRDILKLQGAEDDSSYDCWKDISRTEKLTDSGFAHGGIFICIANDKHYWSGNCSKDTMAYVFRMNLGSKCGGENNWNLANCTEKLLKARPNLHIRNSYELAWQDF